MSLEFDSGALTRLVLVDVDFVVLNGVVADGLAITQKEKLASLAESVEFEGEREYRDKLVTLKESYFPSQLRNQKSQPETLSEGFDIAPVSYSGSMESYLKAASLLSNK